MATSASYITFVSEQLDRFGDVRTKKMFGEYMVYLDGRPILVVCDNIVYVKKLPVLAALLSGAECGFPYDGAKEHYILDIENRELLDRLIPQLYALTPQPKPKKKQ